MLGPPKTAFASSSSARTFGKSSSLEPNDSENQASTARSFPKDQDFEEREGDRRGAKFAGINAKRNFREDKEDWAGRPRRTFDNENEERRPRRIGDREGQRWETKKEPTETDESRRDNRDEGRYGQRHSQGRGKFDQPWFRTENGTASLEDNKNQGRQRGWGRDRRSGAGAENDWSGKLEHDPEWMDAIEPEDQKQAHTAEDFQKWKERMKADNEKRTPINDVQETLESVSLEEKEPEIKPVSLKIKPETDKFFELYGEKKDVEEIAAATEAKKHKTRFAALFSPPTEVPKPVAEPSVPEPTRPASTDADQEGFQRILQMLGGRGSGKSTASPMDALLGLKASTGRSEQTSPNPLMGLFGADNFAKAEQRPAEAKPQSRNSGGGLESLLGTRSPKTPSEKKTDSDFLLRLMQQSKASPSPQLPQNQAAQSNQIPGILQMPEALSRARHSMKSPNELPAFFNDPLPNEVQRAGPPGLDERQRYSSRPPLPNEAVYPPRPEYAKSPQEYIANQQPPMQRPPGLGPPAGWPYQQLPAEQQPPAHIPFHGPPGLSNPASRGPYFPPGPPMPQHMNMPPPPSGRAPQETQRKYMSGNAPFLPPGMQPPPGFMGAGGPPPGFPPMPISSHDAMLGMRPNGPPMGGAGGQQGIPPSHLMELFAAAGDRGRGPMGPGPYR